MLLVHLLQCQRPESAIIVSRERRGFYAMVDLVEELFAVYVSERTARDELRAVGNLAKKLYEERNKCVHSLWYLPMEETSMPPARRYAPSV